MAPRSARTGCAFLAIVCLLAAWPAAAQRLDSTVVPSHYELAFDVDPRGSRIIFVSGRYSF